MRDDPTAQALADLRRDLHTIYARLGQAATAEPDPGRAAILSGLQLEIDAVRQTLVELHHRDPVRLVQCTHNLVAAALDIAKDADALRARHRPDGRPR
jgi:hypothetical protein